MAIQSNVEKWADGQGLLDAVYHGDTKVWPKPPQRPMGMNKATNQSLPANTTVALTGWQVRPGYPYTIIANDRLAPGFAGAVTVYAKASITGSMGFFESAIAVDVMLNDSSIRSGSISGNGATTVTLSAVTVTLTETDTLWLRMRGSGSSNQIAGAESTTGRETYLYFELA